MKPAEAQIARSKEAPHLMSKSFTEESIALSCRGSCWEQTGPSQGDIQISDRAVPGENRSLSPQHRGDSPSDTSISRRNLGQTHSAAPSGQKEQHSTALPVPARSPHPAMKEKPRWTVSGHRWPATGPCLTRCPAVSSHKDCSQCYSTVQLFQCMGYSF